MSFQIEDTGNTYTHSKINKDGFLCRLYLIGLYTFREQMRKGLGGGEIKQIFTPFVPLWAQKCEIRCNIFYLSPTLEIGAVLIN